MIVSTGVTVRDAALQAVASLADGGSIKIYANKGKRSLLAELTLGTPAFGEPEGGKMLAYEIEPDAHAKATGKATRYEIVQADGTVMWDGDVSPKGSGGSLELDNVNIQAGAEVSVKSLSCTIPSA